MKKILMTAACAAIALTCVSAWAEDAPGTGPNKRLEALDTNGDGFIDQNEFLARPTEAFKRMDKDGDGKLSKEERQAGRAERKEKREERHEKMKEMHQEHSATPGTTTPAQ